MRLFDWFTALTSARRGQSTGTISGEQNATIGLSWPGDYSTPEDFERNPDLQGRQRYSNFNVIRRRVPVAAAYWGLVSGLVQRAVFTVDAPEEQTEFVFGAVGSQWPRALSDLSEALMVGVGIVEWTARAEGSRYMLDSLRRIPPGSIERFQVDENGQVDGFQQFVEGRLVTIPRWKTMYATEGHGPAGEGALSDCADDALTYLRHKKLLFEAISANLRDIPDFFIDPEASASKKPFATSADQVIANKDRHANVRSVLPSDVQTVLAADGSDRPVAMRKNEAVQHPPVPIADNDKLAELSKDVAIALGVQALLLGQDGAGSLALARVEVNTLHQRLNGVLGVMAAEVERMVGVLFAFNGWMEPKVVVDTSAWREPRDLADLLSTLNGVNPERYSEALADIMQQAGLPLPDGEGGSVAGEGTEPEVENE